MSLAWDFIVATALVTAMLGLFLFALQDSSKALSQNLFLASKQRDLLYRADFLLKNCFPQGVALCQDDFLFSHVAHPQASLSFGSGGLCVKRLVLQDGEEKILSVCG